MKFKDVEQNYISSLDEDGLVMVKLIEKVGRSWRSNIGNGDWYLIKQILLIAKVQIAGSRVTLSQRNDQVDYRDIEISSGEDESAEDEQ